MAFKERSTVAHANTLELPIYGKTYVVHDVTAAVGLTVQRLMELGQAAASGKNVDDSELSDGEERDLYRKVLGDTLDELVDDGLEWSDIKAVALTAIAWITVGREQAEKVWNNGGEPPGEAEGSGNRASRRAAARSAPTPTASRTTSKGSPKKASARRK